MQWFASSIGTEEHEAVLIGTVSLLAIGDIGIVVLTVDLDISHLNGDLLTLSRCLQAHTLLVIDEGHVVHLEVCSLIHSRQTTISVLVGRKVASFVAAGA